MKTNRTVVLATGGTGGHIFPAIALYEFLEQQKFQPFIIGDNRFENFIKYFDSTVNYKLIISDRLSGNFLNKFLGLIKLLLAVFQALFLLIKKNPAVVIGFGGYITAPTIVAAKLLGKKIILHEQNTVLGNANKILARLADTIATSFPEVKNLPPNSNVVYTGNFIRQRMENTKFSYQEFKNGEATITVMGGSQGASILSDVVPEALGSFAKKSGTKLKVFHQARPEDLEAVKAKYEQHKILCKVQPFFQDIDKRMTESHLIISRSGASTITDLATIGRAAIFIPIPFSFGNHQYYNAKFVEDRHAGWIIEQKYATPDRIADRLSQILSDSELLRNYSKNMSKLKKNGLSLILPVIKKLSKT